MISREELIVAMARLISRVECSCAQCTSAIKAVGTAVAFVEICQAGADSDVFAMAWKKAAERFKGVWAEAAEEAAGDQTLVKTTRRTVRRAYKH